MRKQMNDPHVASLKYQVVETDYYNFEDPPDIKVDTNDFKGLLSNSVLILEPKEHYDSEESIRPIADKFIQSWEINAGIKYGFPHFRFRYEGADIEDRNAAPGTAKVNSTQHLHVVDKVHITRTNSEYPAPPLDFQITPEVELFWFRYCRYLEEKELLLSMAYSCLTFLEKGLGRKNAAIHYGIQLEVLDKLGELTSERGDNATARKFNSTTIPLSLDERVWIESTIKAIIEHIAKQKPGKILKMDDLPALD